MQRLAEAVVKMEVNGARLQDWMKPKRKHKKSKTFWRVASHNATTFVLYVIYMILFQMLISELRRTSEFQACHPHRPISGIE